MKKLLTFIMSIFMSLCSAQNNILLNDTYLVEEGDKKFLKIDLLNKIVQTEYGYGSIDDRSSDFKIYVDNYGYKHVSFNNKNFLIIDGVSENYTFQYTGDSLSKDIQSVKKNFTTIPRNWNNHHSLNDSLLNGIHITNETSSSALKDRNFNYSLSRSLMTYGQGDTFRYWINNNIPWVEGKNDDGIGEFVEFDIAQPVPNVINNVRIDGDIKLIMLNGYVDPLKPYLFYENNRVKAATIITDKGEVRKALFNDVVEFTELSLPSDTLHIIITIDEIFPGTKYRDTCISAFEIKYKSLYFKREN